MPDVGTVIAIGLLVLAAVIAVRLIRRRLKGDGGCGCGCSGCASSVALVNGEEPGKGKDSPPCCCGQTAEPRVAEK